MDELRDLYQQVILDHNKDPRNFGEIEPHSHDSEGYNPLCGDKIHIYLQVEDGVIKDVSFEGSGCAISKASASLMTTLLKGKTADEAQQLFRDFQKLITSENDEMPDFEEIGKLSIFAGVKEFPTRVKCAALAWHTMVAALKNKVEPVTTE
ncbi:MAG: SUF system NifU family Fe-S cluster assembly protein [Aliifodinibius sp.]|nr:SUF system NifU family Fe-S cluster assembly protein [Fodinibius sp.]NIV16701.1 SUF system NifU family Fe-S cluster assembly protein [Fodinibius sp.]NIY30268.1 SUF system NifU family Fe-S cluster assembly protein [Fodinibius sp.]